MHDAIISHPENPFGESPLLLSDHLSAVARRTRKLASESIQTQAHTIGMLHDFGKITPQFQTYIRPSEDYSGSDLEKQHSPLGTFVTFYALRCRNFDDRDVVAGALAVARHHGTIPDAARYTATSLPEMYDHGVLHEQVKAIEKTHAEAANEILKTVTDGAGSWAEFRNEFENETLIDQLESMGGKEVPLVGIQVDPEQLPSRLYDRTLQYWGALTLADKSHAGGFSEADVLEHETLGRNPLESYIESLQDTATSDLERQLNSLREDARQQVVKGVHAWLRNETKPSVATLRLPTGLGKTFTGITGALSAVEYLEATNPERTIIYALPFTSIIEQTRGLFEDEEIWGADPSDSAFTVHHHLSDTVTYGDQAEDRDEIEFLGESWRSGLVLTTFVQLFESLIGPSKSQGTKLSALERAVVILDEPQALPKPWWDAMPRIFEILTDEYGAYVLSMTATQPSLFSDVQTADVLALGSEHECETCPDERQTHSTAQYFEGVQRVEYHFDDSVFAHQPANPQQFVGHDEAADRIYERATKASTSVLSVCNTIESSRVLTEELKRNTDTRHLGTILEEVLRDKDLPVQELDAKQVAEEVLENAFDNEEAESEIKERETVWLLTFNSRFRPFDRRVLITLADELSTAGIPFVVVATQAIEAGVDLSFNTVFRDIAPIDSIVQAAGRCNRSFEWGESGGDIFVWTLAGTEESDPSNPTDDTPSMYVYERSVPGHLRLVADTLDGLEGQSGVSDNVVSDVAVRRYFERLSEKDGIGDRSITGEIDTCQGDRLRGRTLIDDYDTVDVVVAVSESDEQSIEAVGSMFRPVPNRKAFDAVENLTQFRVSMPVSDIESAIGLPRLDKRSRDDEDGVQLFQYTGEAGITYELDGGGLVGTDDVIGGRFTVI